jgi:hypothetical protein
LIRVIHYRREEIDRLNDGKVIRELIDAGILGPLQACDEIGVRLEGQTGQRYG